MGSRLGLTWTLRPETPPKPILPCRRCGGPRTFRSSGKFRLNANGKRIDAWLIYKCETCEATWNRPVVERGRVGSLDPERLAALERNDPALAEALALDVSDLRPVAFALETSARISVLESIDTPVSGPVDIIDIRLKVSAGVGMRLDKFLASTLGVTRSRLGRLAQDGTIAIEPGGARALRKPPKDGQRILADASVIGDLAMREIFTVNADSVVA